MKSVYVETSIVSYLTARPSRDLRAAAWQQITAQWWEQTRARYELFTSEIVVLEAGEGSPEAAQRRLDILRQMEELPVDQEAEALAGKLIAGGSFPPEAEVDALHVAVAAVHDIALFLTWNCRHINNAETKPVMRSICGRPDMPVRKSARPRNFFRRRLTMYRDEILTELWKIRDAYAARHNHNLREIVADLRKRQQTPLSRLVDRRHRPKETKPSAD